MTTAIVKAKALVTSIRRGSGLFVVRPERVTEIYGSTISTEYADTVAVKRALKINRALFALHFAGKLDATSQLELQNMSDAQPTLALPVLVAQAAAVYGGGRPPGLRKR